MGWLSIILLIVQWGPEFIEFVMKIIDLIKQRRDPKEQAELRRELKERHRRSRKAKDPGPLKEMIARLSADG
jgi:hypothetical protein